MAFLALSFSVSGGFEQPAHDIARARTTHASTDNLTVLISQFPSSNGV
jgi:hypothetical protein